MQRAYAIRNPSGFRGADAVAVDGARLGFRKALIATGARPLLPDIEGLAAAGYLNNETVFELTALPPSLLVIGGGPLGCELAQAFARFGCRTLICHSEPLFLPKEERDAAQMVSHALAHDGVEIHLNSTVVAVRLEGGRKHVTMVNDGNTALPVMVVHKSPQAPTRSRTLGPRMRSRRRW